MIFSKAYYLPFLAAEIASFKDLPSFIALLAAEETFFLDAADAAFFGVIAIFISSRGSATAGFVDAVVKEAFGFWLILNRLNNFFHLELRRVQVVPAQLR